MAKNKGLSKITNCDLRQKANNNDMFDIQFVISSLRLKKKLNLEVAICDFKDC